MVELLTKEEKKFNKLYDEMKEAVEHIGVAISHSEIYTDLDFIKKKANEMEKILEVI